MRAGQQQVEADKARERENGRGLCSFTWGGLRTIDDHAMGHWLVRRLRLIVVVGVAAMLSGCDCSISEDTARSWQQSLSEGLVPGYRDFKALDCSGDIGWSLFSYQLPPDADPAGVVPTLRTQTARTAPPMFAVTPSGSTKGCWAPVLETATELQLQCPTVTYGSPGYDEWRFLIDPARRSHRHVLQP